MSWQNRFRWSSNSWSFKIRSNIGSGLSSKLRIPTRLFRLTPPIGISIFIIILIASGAISSSILRRGAWDANQQFEARARRNPSKGVAYPPVFAYWISGTGGDGRRILRLLKAVYHPRNRYLLHLDAGSDSSERSQLARSIQSESLFRAFDNVDVIGKAYVIDQTGPSAVAATLHGASVLLKTNANWDWFITLSASDYPIVTQDDLLHAFTNLSRNLNFLDHTSELGWKETARFDRIAVDPSLYMATKSKLVYPKEKRATPDAFKLFTGSPWVILSRHFIEHVVRASDNLPRILLMYFSNVAYANEAYFHTVICNSPEFMNTTVNNDLRFFAWDDPPQLEPLMLNQTDYWRMTASGAAFARKFREGDEVLREVDEKILRRSPEGVAAGKWCSGEVGDACSSWGDIDDVEPGLWGVKLRRLVAEAVQDERMRLNQCKFLPMG